MENTTQLSGSLAIHGSDACRVLSDDGDKASIRYVNGSETTLPLSAVIVLPDWREDPQRFVSMAEDDRLGAVTLACIDYERLRGCGESTAADGWAMLQIFEFMGQVGATEFIRHGSVAFPSTPACLRVFRALRSECTAAVTSPDLRTVKGVEDSPLGRLLDAVDKAATVGGSMLGTIRNVTRTDEPGIKLRLVVGATARGRMPNGANLPPRLLSSIVGVTFDGADDLQAWQRDAGACDSGTAEFLDRFGISFEYGYECDSCGQETNGGDGITWCESFTIDEKMAQALEGAGYADSVREWAHESGADDLSAMLNEESDAEILDRMGPAPVDESKATPACVEVCGRRYDGIRFDRSCWRFEPEPMDIEGAEDLGGDEAVRFGMLCGILSERWTALGMLPPIPGRLVGTTESLRWEPDEGRVSDANRVSGGATYYRDVLTGREWLRIPNDPRQFGLEGDTLIAPVGKADIGSTLSRALRIAQGETRL